MEKVRKWECQSTSSIDGGYKKGAAAYKQASAYTAVLVQGLPTDEGAQSIVIVSPLVLIIQVSLVKKTRKEVAGDPYCGIAKNVSCCTYST